MAFSSGDWTIDYGAKTVTNNDAATGTNLPSAFGDNTYVGPILEFFQWLATQFAAAGQMDDDYGIESQTPTVYKWLNGWTFGHANDYKYLSGGSIVDPVGSGSTYADSLWANLYTIGSQTSGTQIALIQNDVEVGPWWITGNLDILVLVKNTGSWIQSDAVDGTPTNGGVWLYAREFGDLYDHGFADLSGGGRNPLGINTAADSSNKSGEIYLPVDDETGWTVGNFVSGDGNGAVGKIAKFDTGNNYIYLNAVRVSTYVSTETLTEYSDRELQTSTGQTASMVAPAVNVVKGYTNISTTFSSISRDLNNGNGAQSYDCEVDLSSYTVAQGYEWLKFITRYGSVSTTYQVGGDDGQEYRSASTGTYTDVKVAPFGTQAGSTFYGARGIWLKNYAVADFVLIDSSNTEQSPPDYQKVTITHASLSSCQLFVAEISSSAIKKDQYTVSTATASTIVATALIDINKTPQSGPLRVGDTRYTYSSYASTTFHGVTPNSSTATSTFYVPLVDVSTSASSFASDNIIYNSAINVRTVVRKYGFKPYTTDTQFGDTGLAFSPILTDDPQAT